jgi:hypothetical protein
MNNTHSLGYLYVDYAPPLPTTSAIHSIVTWVAPHIGLPDATSPMPVMPADWGTVFKPIVIVYKTWVSGITTTFGD